MSAEPALDLAVEEREFARWMAGRYAPPVICSAEWLRFSARLDARLAQEAGEAERHAVAPFAASGVGAAAVTFGLFFLMQYLIVQSPLDVPEEVTSYSIDLLPAKPVEESKPRRRLPPRLPTQQQPPPPQLSPVPQERPGVGTLSAMGPGLDPRLDLLGPVRGSGPSNSAAIPVVRVPPMYPPRAHQRGIEGWVLVEFTITPTGAVKDPSVIEADPPNVFNRATLRAIRRWKYKPRFIDGQPVERPRVRTVISFALEDQS